MGAGCSKALFNIPIQCELVNDFLAWDLQNEAALRLSREVRQLLEAIKDIELIVSHYHNVAYPPNGPPDGHHKRDLIFLRSALARYLDEKLLTNQKKYPDSIPAFQRFLEKAGAASELFIVTTNYDLVLEDILETTFGVGSYWYPGVSKESNVPILKLHGSINWMEDRCGVNNQSFERPGEVLVRPPTKMALLRPPRDGDWGYVFRLGTRKYTPIIVPFLFQKRDVLTKDNEHWTKVFDEVGKSTSVLMTQAKKLVFLGYSLPAADYHMFSILDEVFSNSTAECCHVVGLCGAKTNLMKLAELRVKDTSIFEGGVESYIDKLP